MREVRDEHIDAGGNRDRSGGLGRRDGGFRTSGAVPVAQGKVTPGALNDRYEIPEITFSRRGGRGLLLSGVFLSAWIAWHLGWQSLMLALCAFPSIFFRSVGWMVSWLDRPTVVSSSSARDQLARLHVTVAIPAYNEDPGLLDRCLYALVKTRPPQLVCVIDDGSATDYTALKHYWVGHWPAGTEI